MSDMRPQWKGQILHSFLSPDVNSLWSYKVKALEAFSGILSHNSLIMTKLNGPDVDPFWFSVA